MNQAIPKHDVLQTERQILAVLLQGFNDGPLEESLKQSLAAYCWRAPDHEAIFAALIRFPSSHPSMVLVELPARLTRLGFPDVEWEFLQQPHGLNRSETAALVQTLLDANKG